MAALTVFPWHSGCIYRNCVVRRAPPSFPTRRSSDLRACAGTARKARARARALSDAALGLRRSLPPQSLLSGGRLCSGCSADGERGRQLPQRPLLVPLRRVVPAGRPALRRREAAGRRPRARAAAGLLDGLHRRRAVLLRQRCLLHPAARRLCGGRAADGGEPEPAASGGRARQRRTAEFPGHLVLLRLGEGLLPLRHRVQGGLAERSGHAAAGALSASSPQAPNVTSLSKGIFSAHNCSSCWSARSMKLVVKSMVVVLVALLSVPALAGRGSSGRSGGFSHSGAHFSGGRHFVPGGHFIPGGRFVPGSHFFRPRPVAVFLGVGIPFYASYPPPLPYYYEYAPGYYAPPAAIPQQQGYWYFCQSANAYYPYVQQCPEGWQPVVPVPPS